MADRQLSVTEAWALHVLSAPLPVEHRMLGLALAALAAPGGEGISAARAHLGSRFRIHRSLINGLVTELRDKGLVERSPEPRRWPDEHRLLAIHDAPTRTNE